MRLRRRGISLPHCLTGDFCWATKSSGESGIDFCFCGLAPILHCLEREHAIHVAARVCREFNSVSHEAGYDWRIHAVGDGEAPEQETTLVFVSAEHGGPGGD